MTTNGSWPDRHPAAAFTAGLFTLSLTCISLTSTPIASADDMRGYIEYVNTHPEARSWNMTNDYDIMVLGRRACEVMAAGGSAVDAAQRMFSPTIEPALAAKQVLCPG